MAPNATYAFHRCLGRGGFGEVYLASRTGAEGLERKGLLACERFYEGLRLTEQAGLSSAPERYGAWLEQRMARLPALHPELVPLVRACLAYDPFDRPSPAELQLRAEALGEALGGAPLRRWARDAALPPELEVEGAPLVGQTASEDRPADSAGFGRAPAPIGAPRPPGLPWAVLAAGFLSLGLGATVLAVSAFAAGLVAGW